MPGWREVDRRGFLFAGAAALAFGFASRPLTAAPVFETLFYPSDGLRMQAYYYPPPSGGRAPVIVYNHGFRVGNERASLPRRYIGTLFGAAGYGVLVPERRGYGASDGKTFVAEVGRDKGERFMGRLQQEAGDVLAALDLLPSLPSADPERVGMIGWSFGGIISLLAGARSTRFGAIVDQAGGAINWDRSPALRRALVDAAATIAAPMLMMVSANDASTASITEPAAARRTAGLPVETHIFPPFMPKQNPNRYPGGHMLFGLEGVGQWGRETVEFFNRNLNWEGRG